MSITKNKKFLIIFLLTMVSWFFVGCKNTTPVEDIYFNLDAGEQMVLIVGQTLDMKDYVSVRPAYATNQKYSISSFDENIVKVENNQIIAISEGITQVRVVAEDNALKEDLMSVVVKKTKTALTAPKNLTYNVNSQSFHFDTVTYASSYTLKINGEDIELGNSNVFNLSQYKGNAFDSLLSVQVRANAPTYSYALETSAFSSELKIYQASVVKNVRIENGVLQFDKLVSTNKCNIYFGENLIFDNSASSSLSLTNLDEIYAGINSKIKIEVLVSDEIKAQYGNDVNYYNSSKEELGLSVLEIPRLNISSTTIAWQNIIHSAKYAIYIDGVKKTETTNNYFNLEALSDYDALITPDVDHIIKVVPMLSEDSVNVGKTNKDSEIKVKRLGVTSIRCEGYDLKWTSVDNVSAYSLYIEGVGVLLNTSTNLTTLSMQNYPAGNYLVKISAIASEEVGADNVHYLTGAVVSKEISKNTVLSASIIDYQLKIDNFGFGECSIEFDEDAFNKTINGVDGVNIVDLSSLVFEAGEHEITLKHLGNANSIDSDELKINFTQLEKISSIAISKGEVKVSRSATNAKAVIKLETSGGELAEPIVIEDVKYKYNTEDDSLENYLNSGNYSTKVYVCGDGSSTFSYREAGVLVACSNADFEVLKAPTCTLPDTAVEKMSLENIANAMKYSIYSVADAKTHVADVNANEYNFALSSGSVSYAVQAIGDGVSYLNSIMSTPITITRLLTPTLAYNNTNNVISKADSNDFAKVFGYKFTHNGASVQYDFKSAFALADKEIGNKFTLETLAVAGSNNNYYLNSLPFSLILQNISNSVLISLSGLDNVLTITPAGHAEQFNLVVEFGLSSGNKTFETVYDEGTGNYALTNGLEGTDEIKLPYSYNGTKYNIQLIDADHNAIIEEMVDEFSVKVRFVKPSTGNDLLINSEFSESTTLNLNIIDNTTEISVSETNQIVLTPSNHSQEYSLVVVINNGEELVFNSNGGNKLISNTIELDYEFIKGSYYIKILDEKYNPLIENIGSGFTVKVKYGYKNNGVNTDLDSEFSATKAIQTQPVANITRDGQNIKISNIKPTYTFENYTLLINNEYILTLDDTAINENSFIVFNVEYIYKNTPANLLAEVNTVEVVVTNIDTSVDSPIIACKGGCVNVSKTQTVTLNSFKYNNNEDGKNNNSVVITFDAVETAYNKQYVVEIYNEGKANIQIKKFIDSDAKNGKISFNLDDISLEEKLYINAHVETSGNFEQKGSIIEVFNSINSNELSFNKIKATSNMAISNGVLTFDSVGNTVGYEIWEKTGVGFVKLSDLITNNSYDFALDDKKVFEGKKELVIKAISKANGYTNSSYSESIIVQKVEQPDVSVVNGKFNINLSSILTLIGKENLTITPEVVNDGNVVAIDLNALEGGDISLKGTTLVAEPYLFLGYTGESLIAEDLSISLKFIQTGAVDGVYYINPDVVDISVYGLFAPTQVNKIDDSNNVVEKIVWTENTKNTLPGEEISVGYIFTILYQEQEKTYYSNDPLLWYYDDVEKTYKSYSSVIVGNNAIFPAGYGELKDGKPETLFGPGKYTVSVQTVPNTTIEGINLCSSAFTSQVYEFEIMEAPELAVIQGKVVWEKDERADSYNVYVYKQNETEPFVDKVTLPEYDFANSGLNGLSGVYKVVVKAISEKADILNSAESEPVFVYRLPEAKNVSIDDGYLILEATNFFTSAIIEFIDTLNNKVYVIPSFDNSLIASESLATLKVNTEIESWEELTDDSEILETYKFAISLNKNDLKILEGRDYTVNIRLLGNTDTKFGTINSSTVIAVSNLISTKLKANTTEVSLGEMQFMPDADYVTISSAGVYANIIDFNYSFNNETSTDFWRNTTVYKISVEHSAGSVDIYAVDYYSFITAINNGTIAESEYELIINTSDLYACVKYAYGEGKHIYFNVYEHNKINFRDYDNLYYYPIQETMTDGVNTIENNNVTTSQDYTTLALGVGGSFTVKTAIMGGDSYVKDPAGTNKFIGFITSETSNLRAFVRYGENQIVTHEGKIKFKNLTTVIDGITIDSPIYKLSITPLNSANSTTYYLYHTTEEDAKTIAMRHDVENYESATYIQATLDEDENFIIFDMSNYFDAGTYKVSVRTLAGLGLGENEDKDYLLNAKVPGVEYTLHKLTDAKFASNKGVLEFNQSYIVIDGTKHYYDSYELTLYDVLQGKEFIYSLDRTTEGVKYDEENHIISYVIPQTMTINGEDVLVDSGKQFKIKIRAIATENYILNGTYAKDETNTTEDFALEFTKSLGIEDLQIENGILKWKIKDIEKYYGTIIKIAFVEGTDYKYITISENVISEKFIKVTDENGEYLYHYYVFTDAKYPLDTSGSVDITDGIDYEISGYTIGKNTTTKNIVNSNPTTINRPVNRLSKVNKSGIKTYYGKLTWDAVQDAVAYDILIEYGSKQYTCTTTTNELDLLTTNFNLAVGTYSVSIRAIGGSSITGMWSDSVGGFKQLDVVDVGTIKIEGSNIVWGAVENATGYNVVFEYFNGDGDLMSTSENVETCSYTAPSGVVGKFTIRISAIGIGDGKEFNSEAVSYTSSNERPLQVESFTFDYENSRFVIEVNEEDFSSSDILLISYDFAEYAPNEETGLVEAKTAISQTARINYSNGKAIYCYPLTTMAVYSNIYVQVLRPKTLPSPTVGVENLGKEKILNLHLFSYGSGAFDNVETLEVDESNPYRISNAEELLNIKYFTSANYVLTSSINLENVDFATRLSIHDAVICNTFGGLLDGKDFSIIKSTPISLNNATNFALFNTLNGATIKNLAFGEENTQLILSNMFANSTPSVVKLSLIATGATNSIINNIKVLDFKIAFTSSSTNKLEVYIASLVNNTINTTISNFNVNFTTETKINTTDTSFVGGVISDAKDSDILDGSIVYTMTTTSTNAPFTYVGGVVASSLKNTTTTEISNVDVEIAITNARVTYLGGVVGYAKNIGISECVTTGTYSKEGINYTTRIGGIVGQVDNATIQNSGSYVTFNVKITNTNTVYIGEIAGQLTTLNDGICTLNSCYTANYDEEQEKTYLSTQSITLGLYGAKGAEVTITSCYQKQQEEK